MREGYEYSDKLYESSLGECIAIKSARCRWIDDLDLALCTLDACLRVNKLIVDRNRA